MMKRFLSLVLCLALVLTMGTAQADDYTLMEKLQRQIDFGNGVKGAFVLEAAGESDLSKLLASLNGTEFQIRSIKKDNQFQLYLYTLDGEKQVGLTRFYGNDQDVYMSSDLLPELVLTYHTDGDWLESLMKPDESANPNWLTAAMALMTQPETVWAENWEPLLAPYYADIELWMSDYALEPQVHESAEGDKLMSVRFEIPADAVKAQTKALLKTALNDEALMALLRAQLSEEQQFVYLTPGLMYYYEAAIDALPLSGVIVLDRELSTMGEVLSTALQLPLPESAPWNELSVEQTQTDTMITLEGAEQSVSLEMKKASSSATGASYGGVIRVTPGAEDTQAVALDFTLSRTTSHTVDDDTRAHDVNTWKLYLTVNEAVQGDADYLNFEPISATLMTHVHSKNAKGNATTLEVSALVSQGTESLAVAGSIKTASPWVLDTLPTEGAENAAAMTDTYLAEVLGQYWVNLLAELSALKPAELPVPEAELVPTEEPAPTEEPVPTEEPAPVPESVPVEKATPSDLTAAPTAVPATVTDMAS